MGCPTPGDSTSTITAKGSPLAASFPHLFHVVQGGVYHKQSRPHVNPYIYDDIKTIRDHTHLSAHGGARFYLADAFRKTVSQSIVHVQHS